MSSGRRISCFDRLAIDVVVSCVMLSFSPTTTSVAQSNGFNFFFWGDWGRNLPSSKSESGVNFEESVVANRINEVATTIRPAFMCVLGDNFYDNGVTSTTDPLWTTYYRSLYTAPATFVPWYPVFGNHDYAGKHPQPEIDYFKERRDSRWIFPDYQYSRRWFIPGSGGKIIQIVFINTVTLCPEVQATQCGFPPNPTNGFPNPNITYAKQNENIWLPTLQWIQQTLSQSTAHWLLVAGHYDMFTNSVGGQHSVQGKCLQARLLPLLQKYGVAVYMNGHQHNFQHHLVGNMHFLTVGHGCDKSTALSPGTPPGLIFNKTIGGFAIMNVTSNDLNFRYIDENGNTIHMYDIPYTSRRRRTASLRGGSNPQ